SVTPAIAVAASEAAAITPAPVADAVTAADTAEPFAVGVVLFRFASQEPSLAELEPVIEYLNNHPQQHIEVVGHADSSGPEEFNLTLSKQRASTIARHLQDGGIAAQRLSVVGAGSAIPLASNDTAAGRALNRRVEIILTSK